jgi:signal transduction histidine kinase/ActR/RegA family two-component response regulator
LGLIGAGSSDVRWLRADVVPQFRPGESSPFEFYTIFDDVTAQRQLEQARQAERQQLEAILETMDEGVFAVRADGVIAVINAMARQLLGVDASVAIKTYHDLEQRAGTVPIGSDGQIIAQDVRPIARVLRGERLRELELCVQSISGSELRWLSYSGTPVYGADGTISLGVVTAQDITSRKQDALILQTHTEALSRNNAELTRALQLKDAFLAMMSHELRTPLHIILGFSEAMEEQIYGPISLEQRNALVQVSQSGRHLLAILADILDMAHIDAGAEILELQPIDLESLCHSALQFVYGKAQQKHIHLLRTIQQGVSGLRADERRLTQILVNLLDNAVKFTPAGGQVGLEVTSDPGQGQIQFVVWDTGIGIARQDYEHLFQPFSQIDTRLSREYGGVGLGLSLVQRLVDLHGGSVSVDSTPGRGSRFTVRLPWSSDDNVVPLGEEQVVVEFPAPALTQPLRVLVADDHEVTLQLYSELLQRQGCHVLTARNGEEALAQARLQHPDLAIIDIQMPVMDGLTAIQQMRADVALERLPIIALTALAMPGDRDRCLEAGANSYLAKPVSLQRLLATMTALIDSSGADSNVLEV